VEQPIKDLNSSLDPSEQQLRLFERFPSRFPARFKDTRTDYGTDVYLRNASLGGIKITTKERLYLNDNVALEVELPDGKEPMTLRGEVVWVKSKEPDLWDVGIKFHKIVLMDLWRPFKCAEPDLT
jgi:hypothetical protein